MRNAPSQTATVSLPGEMLAELDGAAERLSATRSELVRAALRDYLRRLRRDDAVLARFRESMAGAGTEEEIAAAALAHRRSRNTKRSA